MKRSAKKVDYINRMNLKDTMDAIGLSAKIQVSIKNKKIDFTTFAQAINLGWSNFLQEIPGVGPKTAEKIIVRGRAFFAEKPTTIKCDVPVYHSRIYRYESMLSVGELSALKALETAKTYAEVMTQLKWLVNYETTNVKAPFKSRGDYNPTTLPCSMLSERLGIAPKSWTDKICLFEHGQNKILNINQDAVKDVSGAALGQLNKLKSSFTVAYLTRLCLAGFYDIDNTWYRFYTFSSGQLKKDSGYCLKAEIFKEENAFVWGGLTPKEIVTNLGAKHLPMTKTLQYRALPLSKSINSKKVLGFALDIHHVIVVDESEKMMHASDVTTVTANYEVSRGASDNIANNMFDGAMMLDANVFGNIAAQIRAYGFKGAAISFPWKEYCKERGYDCSKIVAYDGVEHDLVEEDIYAICDTSVFKMAKHYGNWKHYVECMERLNQTEIFFVAIDEEEYEDKRLSRQMLQTLVDASDEELWALSDRNRAELDRFNNINDAIEIVSEVNRPYSRRSNMAKAISAYPEAIVLPTFQNEVQGKYIKERNQTMAGKLMVNGRYYFVFPDMAARCDIIFGHKSIDDPTIGELKAGECHCAAFPADHELIVLRSPHAYHEWGILKNIEERYEYSANVIVANVHDLTYRRLQFDYDGDHLLVIDDPRLVEIVKRTQKKHNINVLYYEPAPLDPDKVPQLGTDAYTFTRQVAECVRQCAKYNKVGQYSNYLTSLWAKFTPNTSKEEAQKLLEDAAKITAGTNFAVDAQKTFAMEFLPNELVEQYKQKPHSDRYLHADPDHPSNDKEYWDTVCNPEFGDGTIDRLGKMIDAKYSAKYYLNTDDVIFDWTIFKFEDPRFQKQARKWTLDEELSKFVIAYGRPKIYATDAFDKVKSGMPIGLIEFANILNAQGSEFLKQFRDESDNVVEQCSTLKERISVVRSLMVEFVRNGSPAAFDMTDKEILQWISVLLLRNAFDASKVASRKGDPQTIAVYHKPVRIQRFVFECFGDLLAEAAMENTFNRNKATEEFNKTMDEISVFEEQDYDEGQCVLAENNMDDLF